MDFKTDATSDCEQWVQALRDLLKTSAGNQRRVKMAAKEAMKMNHQSSSLPTAFDVTGCGDTNVNGIYRNLHRTKNGARLYMSEAGYVLSREIIDRKAGWIIGKDQVSVWVFCSTMQLMNGLNHLNLCLFVSLLFSGGIVWHRRIKKYNQYNQYNQHNQYNQYNKHNNVQGNDCNRYPNQSSRNPVVFTTDHGLESI